MAKRNKFNLFKKRICVRPTLLGWVLMLALLVILFRISLVGVYYFLAVNNPVNSKTMVLEGSAPAYVVKDALKYYNKHGYDRLIVTGIPIINYEFIAPYKSTAHAALRALKYYGFEDTVFLANIPSNVLVDRTYHTAVVTRMLFDGNKWAKNFDIYTVGVHSRRSRMMFRKAFGSSYNIGIIAHKDRTFAPNHWWRSSKGFRNVSNEFVATLYVMMFFHPSYNSSVARVELGKYNDSIYYNREDKLIEFSDSTTTRFNKEERESFHGFNYFPPNIDYKIEAQFIVDTSTAVFGMKTNTSRMPNYRTYGYLDFIINDTNYKLTAYQNMDFINDSVYGGSLFVPFTDLTNRTSTYEAGRYIDIPIPNTNTVIIDFNAAYNPYCAYSERWSCPLVPYQNHINTNVMAGEKKYK